MKRLILMGGRPWLAADRGKQFTEALLRPFPAEAKLGFCIFAQPENDWAETRDINMRMFNEFRGNRAVHDKIMTIGSFQNVSAWADIIYMPGGSPYALLDTLKTVGGVATAWDGKIIAGASAGADVLCEGFAYLQKKTFGKGMGWVKASCIPHWRSEDFEGFSGSDWEWAEQESLRQLPGMPVLCIPEGDFIELTVA